MLKRLLHYCIIPLLRLVLLLQLVALLQLKKPCVRPSADSLCQFDRHYRPDTCSIIPHFRSVPVAWLLGHAPHCPRHSGSEFKSFLKLFTACQPQTLSLPPLPVTLSCPNTIKPTHYDVYSALYTHKDIHRAVLLMYTGLRDQWFISLLLVQQYKTISEFPETCISAFTLYFQQEIHLLVEKSYRDMLLLFILLLSKHIITTYIPCKIIYESFDCNLTKFTVKIFPQVWRLIVWNTKNIFIL